MLARLAIALVALCVSAAAETTGQLQVLRIDAGVCALDRPARRGWQAS